MLIVIVCTMKSVRMIRSKEVRDFYDLPSWFMERMSILFMQYLFGERCEICELTLNVMIGICEFCILSAQLDQAGSSVLKTPQHRGT